MNDKLLINRLRDQDRDVLGELYRLYYRDAFLLAETLLRDEVSAKDAVQQVFLWFLEMEDWEHIINFRSYLLNTLVYHCMALLSQSEQQSELDRQYLRIFGENGRTLPADTEPEPDPQEEKLKKLTALLPKLSAKRWEAINLIYWQGYSYPAAAAAMKISINNVKTHIRLGILCLRRHGLL